MHPKGTLQLSGRFQDMKYIKSFEAFLCFSILICCILVHFLWPPCWWHGPQEFYPSEVFFPFYALTNIPAAGFCYYELLCCNLTHLKTSKKMFQSSSSRLSVLVRFRPGIRLFCVLKPIKYKILAVSFCNFM